MGNDYEARLALAPQGNGAAVWESGINDEKWTIQTANLNFLLRPVVTKIEPDSGPTPGGTAMTITGEHLENVTGVSFGSSEAASFEVESETQIEAVSPAGSGTVDTTLTMKEGGVSTMSSADLFTYQEAPAVETGVAAPAQSSATLSATVDPKGLTVSTCEFEYGPSSTYGASVPCSTPPGSGTTPVPVSATLSGLSRYASYYYRIVATNADGTSYGAARTFKTLPELPTVVTGAASPVWEATATMAATVNAHEEAVSDCHFQYGLSLALGTSAPCSSLPSSVETSEVVTAQAGTMHPNTTYYYRIVATNRGGTSYGSTQEFKTLASELPEIGRCVKLEEATGEYTNVSCTTVSPGQETGEYEWQPWPLASRRLTGKGGAATFETVGGVAVKCHESTLTGEYTGSQTASASIVFTGCEASRDLTGKCQSEGANAGEIKTAPLETTLGFITAGAAPKSGLKMSPVSQPDIASFECGTRKITIAGSAIARVGKVDKTSSAFTLKYKAKKGRQSPESFEAGLGSVLVLLDETAEERAGLSTTIVFSGGEALEIKAVA